MEVGFWMNWENELGFWMHRENELGFWLNWENEPGFWLNQKNEPGFLMNQKNEPGFQMNRENEPGFLLNFLPLCASRPLINIRLRTGHASSCAGQPLDQLVMYYPLFNVYCVWSIVFVYGYKVFVSMSVQLSVWTRRFIFWALFELCLFKKKRLKDIHYILERPVFPDVPVVSHLLLIGHTTPSQCGIQTAALATHRSTTPSQPRYFGNEAVQKSRGCFAL